MEDPENIPYAYIEYVNKLSPPPDLHKALEGFEFHTHLCLLYESLEEWCSVVVPFLKIGLRQNERCICIVDDHTAGEIGRYLSQGDIDVGAFQRSGQLVILQQGEIYTREDFFDPDKMIALLVEGVKKSIASGYSALRVSGEMSWVLHRCPTPEKLIEYEGKLNRDFFLNYPCVGLCQYDRQKFSPEIIKAVIMTHPFVIWQGCIYRNFYYLPAEKFLSENRAEYEVDQWLRNMEREYKRERKLTYLATHDPLTGLPNRLLFNDRLTMELARAKRRKQKLAVMLLDIDNFKDVNDALGHKMGDKLLHSIAQRLKSVLRQTDTIARSGGDEFLLILPEIAGEGDVRITAQKILDVLKEPFRIGSHIFHVTASIGFSIHPDDANDLDTLVRYADIAMYRAKRYGRNNYQHYISVFTP